MVGNASSEPSRKEKVISSLSKVSTSANSLKSFWSKSSRNFGIMLVFSSAVAIIIVLMLWGAGTEYRPLYSKNTNFDSSQVLQMLDAENIKYELSQDSGVIMVPHDEVARIRMVLAAKGLKERLPSGFDSLTANSSVGESQFMETAKYRHALEGELARSIVTIDAVNAARVHLAIPKESLFKRKDSEQARASVVANIINGMDLKPNQVDAIINIVAGAVIGLKVENVRVIDQFGRLLSSDLNAGDIAYSSTKQTDFKHKTEQGLVKQASDMLTPVLGLSNFRVQVSSDMDFSKVEETEELYSNPVMRKERTLLDTNNSDLALGIPGSLSNSPPVTGEAAPTSPTNEKTRNETNRDYAVRGKVIKTQHQQGVIEKLNVSVVLNQASAADGGWTQAQLDSVTNIVKTAVGFDTARGDVINVTSMPFIAATGLVSNQYAWYENPSYQTIGRYLFIALISLLLVIFVLRPLVRTITNEHNKSDQNLQGMSDLDIDVEQDKKLPSVINNSNFDTELPSPDSALDVQIQHLRMIADKDPNRVSEILKTWMMEKNSNE
ncbi:flagellar M-ring protein FliF [Vibrio sp. S17_S38]|nr:flagellar M-ring protein FliF [Vibrio sp. S17_S38]